MFTVFRTVENAKRFYSLTKNPTDAIVDTRCHARLGHGSQFRWGRIKISAAMLVVFVDYRFYEIE